MKRVIPFLILLFSISLFAEESRVLRFPTINGDQIVFTYAGDLYSVSSNGGTARKLTTSVGVEIFPRFSPDGKFIAFTGQYDGNSEVYIIPRNGGEPKRLTYTATLNRDDVSDRMGPNNLVMGWKNDNNHILFRSRKAEFNSFKGKLYLANINAEIETELPLPRGGFASYSPDNNKLAYNRVFREFRTWKKYRGGMADDIWIYDFQTKKTENITKNEAQDIIPMWFNNTIYFLSDRDENKRMNLFAYDLNTKETTKLTDFIDFDIKFPSLGDKAIVFENGGFIYSFDLATNQYNKITIEINEDFTNSRNELISVKGDVSNYEISPDGNRALFGARGDVFTVPAEKGITRNLTTSSAVHERNSKWSPDGKYIAYISDKSGEDEIYIISQDGKGGEIQLTKSKGAYKYGILWSPDSKKILWTDRELKISYVDIDTKDEVLVHKSLRGRTLSADWAPDSKWITFSLPQANSFSKIYVYSLTKKEMYSITDDWNSSSSPTFSSDGNFIAFISARNFSPVYSWTEWNHAYVDMDGIYLIALNKDVKNPFEPKSDEVKVKDSNSDESKKKDDKKDEDISVKIDLDGIQNRVINLPIKASNYFGLKALKGNIYYQRRGSNDNNTKLFVYDLDKQKESELGDVDGYEISADEKKILVSSNRNYYISDLPKTKLDLSSSVNLSDLKVNLTRSEEWEQIFNQAWRQMRDFFYVENMHGVDWKAMKEKYEPLVKFVNHRIDLTYVIGEMIGELNIGHAYVGGGDYPKAERIKLGLLGAEISRDPESKFYRINKILKGANWSSELRSPLKEIGVNINENDFIIAVDGKSTLEMNNFYESLIDKAGKQVVLSVNSKASMDGAKEVTVVPISDESSLYYYNWVTENIEKVNTASNGKVGYIHIPNMGVEGLNEFVKYFYPQLTKEGLIIDVRGNGGGNVSPMIIERLRRELAMVNIFRNNQPTTNPGNMHLGPKVTLLDEFSASDGDLFPYRFKKHNLGKLIGKRSWGGVIGIAGSTPFVDGGSLNTPEFGPYDTEGKNWIIEGIGVEPDIYVDNDPAQEYEGYDAQLLKAVEVILEEIKNYNYKLPSPPSDPIRK